MADFDFVTSRIATGGALERPEDVDVVAASGITHVIDCRDDFDDHVLLSRHRDLMVLWNGVRDDGVAKDENWFATSLRFALDGLSAPHTKLLCHCTHGINRGPSTVYLVLRAVGLDADYVSRIIVAARPQAAGGIRYAEQADHFLAAHIF